MYATCLFCNSNLGRNEALEHFQVGRRLAYDADKGRLWVVCGRCERWNLTPLETRWEAIEEAERAFRATRMRVSTDNIGLAQLKEGLELIRIGVPPRLEFAGWRYGDQFGRRQRKYLALTVAGSVAGTAYLVGQLSGVVIIGSGAGLLYNGFLLGKMWLDYNLPKAILHDDKGTALYMSRKNMQEVSLVKGDRDDDWYLRLQHRQLREPRTRPAFLRRRFATDPAPESAILRDFAAYRALAAILPWTNRAGGSVRRVRDAVELIHESADVHELVVASAISKKHRYPYPAETHLATLPARMRLAMEMVLHENDERRALDGEMLLLEARWREAEEIANISDSLLLPPDIEDRMAVLRQRQK